MHSDTLKALEKSAKEGIDKAKLEHAKQLEGLKEGSSKEIDGLKKIIGQDQLNDEDLNKYGLKGLSLTDALKKLVKQVDQSKSQGNEQVTALTKEV